MPFAPNLLLEKLTEQIRGEICRDTKKWKTEYVPLPSNFITRKTSPFYGEHAELVKEECHFIRETQLPDGSYPVPWQWYTDDKGFELAENWWKCNFIIKNLLFLREFG